MVERREEEGLETETQDRAKERGRRGRTDYYNYGTGGGRWMWVGGGKVATTWELTHIEYHAPSLRTNTSNHQHPRGKTQSTKYPSNTTQQRRSTTHYTGSGGISEKQEPRRAPSGGSTYYYGTVQQYYTDTAVLYGTGSKCWLVVVHAVWYNGQYDGRYHNTCT